MHCVVERLFLHFPLDSLKNGNIKHKNKKIYSRKNRHTNTNTEDLDAGEDPGKGSSREKEAGDGGQLPGVTVREVGVDLVKGIIVKFSKLTKDCFITLGFNAKFATFLSSTPNSIF